MIGYSRNQHCNSLARLLIVLCVFGVSCSSSGCNLLELRQPDKTDEQPDKEQDKDKKPDPGPVAPVYLEADYWESLAKLIEAGRFENTDQVVLTAKSQQALKNLKDLSRLSEFESRRVAITETNRKQIADKIRGK